MEYGTQVLGLLTEVDKTSAINVKTRSVRSLIRRSRRRKVHCLSFGRLSSEQVGGTECSFVCLVPGPRGIFFCGASKGVERSVGTAKTAAFTSFGFWPVATSPRPRPPLDFFLNHPEGGWIS